MVLIKKNQDIEVSTEITSSATVTKCNSKFIDIETGLALHHYL